MAELNFNHLHRKKQSPKHWQAIFLGIAIIAVIGVSVASYQQSRKSNHTPIVIASNLPTPSTSTSLVSPDPSSSPTIESNISPSSVPSASVSPVKMATFNLPANLRIPILMYHYIRDFSDPKDRIGTNLSVPPATFDHQLAEIKAAGYTTITFNDLRGTENLPAKPIIITFDDGYDDAYTAALPALQREQMKGVFYIVTDFLNKPNYMTTDQVKSLETDGMEIASHTINHNDLATQPEVIQHKELFESKATLQQLIGKNILDFCYPSGKYNATTLKLDAEAGYETATTTHPGVATGKDFETRPYELPRVRIQRDTDILKALGDKKST